MNKSINVTKSFLPNYEDYSIRIKQLWDSRMLTNSGMFHNELEKRLRGHLNVNYISLFSNGHLALEYALELLEKKGEIITTPFTFASTTQAIIRTGNTPVFCDIKENDYTIDDCKIESLINKNTVAILPIHVYGNVCNVEKIAEIANKHNLKVIYDAAHVFGVMYKGNGIGSYGDLSMFSFHATKVFHTIEGGALTYNNYDFKRKLESLRNFGITSPVDVDYIGGNAKLDEFRAAMGLCNLDIVDKEILRRKIVVERYNENLKDIPGIILNLKQEFVTRNYAYYPVLFKGYKFNRDEVFNLLQKYDVHARKYFYPLTSSFKAYKDKFPIQSTPIAKEVARNILTLPLYADLEIEDVDKICQIIKEGRL